jgi:capsular polysaccharide biosynthesis protein
MAAFMEYALNKSKISLNLHIKIFEARGHIRDHIALFRRARVIVGSHGAGMMNILWSSPGTYVVEVGYTTGMTFPEIYAQISLHLEHQYWICKGYGNYYSPIHIHMEDFIYIFNQIIHQIEIQDGFI